MDVECHVGKVSCVGSTCYPMTRDVLREQVAAGALPPCPVAPSGGIQPIHKWLIAGAALLGAATGLFFLIRRL